MSKKGYANEFNRIALIIGGHPRVQSAHAMRFSHYLAIVACLGAAVIAGIHGATWAVTLDGAAILFILFGARKGRE